MTGTASGPSRRMVGEPVKRKEDLRFLLGRGFYVDDVVRPRMLHVAFLRSAEAHARILRCDLSEVATERGVHATLTGVELAARVPPLVCDSANPNWQSSGWPALAHDRTRYVGECIAAVAADTRYLAEDAIELADVEYETLPVVTSVDDARSGDVPPIHEGWRNHFFIERHFESPGFRDAWDQAPRRLSRRLVMARHSGVPIETRGCVAEWDHAEGGVTLWSSTQQPHVIRTGLADLFGIPEHRVRVIAPDVGGGFGPKGLLYPEEIACIELSRRVGRPVKWIEDRTEHFLSTTHARQQVHDAEIAFGDDGVVHALSVRIYQDTGAYSVYPWTAAMETGMALGTVPGPYRIRNYACDAYAVATNKTPFSGYRGVARPAACFTIERMMDQVARDVGLEPAEVRRRNMVRRDEFPYTSVTGMEYDSGSYVESVDKATATFPLEQWRDEQRRARADGRYLGIGIASYTEQTGHAAGEFSQRGTPMSFGYEATALRLSPSGDLTVYISTHNHGQGMETTMAQVASEVLGIPLDDIRVLFGDTEQLSYGYGTFASRAAVLAGGATQVAATELREQLVTIAAHLLEAAEEDIVLEDGRAYVRGSPGAGHTIAEIARIAYHHSEKLPAGVKPLLEATGTYDAAPGTGTFANATNMALVEVDVETGKVELLRYLVVEDCGQMINPMIVDGQVHGGVAQGIGTALYEEFVYDDDGQMKSTTFMDVLIPGAPEVPKIEVHHLETPSPFTIMGIKGMGEGGAVAPGPCIAGAVEDALTPFGEIFVGEVPVTPDRVRALLDRAGAHPAAKSSHP